MLYVNQIKRCPECKKVLSLSNNYIITCDNCKFPQSSHWRFFFICDVNRNYIVEYDLCVYYNYYYYQLRMLNKNVRLYKSKNNKYCSDLIFELKNIDLNFSEELNLEDIINHIVKLEKLSIFS